MCFSRTKYFNDRSKYSLKWFGWKIIKTIFTPPPLLLQHHYVLTGPRNGSYTLGQVILARKRQSSCTTRTKSALTILRTASTWTRPTHHWCHTQFRSILYEGWDNKIVLEYTRLCPWRPCVAAACCRALSFWRPVNAATRARRLSMMWALQL